MAKVGSDGLYIRGRYFWTYDANGDRKTTGVKVAEGRDAARRRRADMLRVAADPADRAPDDLSLFVALDRLLTARRSLGRSEQTVVFYTNKGRHLLRLLGAETPVARLTADDVRTYVATRRAEKASKHTVHHELTTLKAALRLARADKLYRGDPAELMPLGLEVGYKPRRRYLTQAEAWALVEAMATPEPLRGKSQPETAAGRSAHVAFILGTACRWGESVRARREDVDLKRGLVRLRGTKTERADRVIPIVGPARPFLEYALLRAPGASGLLFKHWGGPLVAIQYGWWRARGHRDNKGRPKKAAEARLRRQDDPNRKLSPNDLRRSLPTWCRQAGVSLDLIADILGHATTTMVRRVYGVQTPEAIGASIDLALGASGRVPNVYTPGGPAGRSVPDAPAAKAKNSRKKAS